MLESHPTESNQTEALYNATHDRKHAVSWTQLELKRCRGTQLDTFNSAGLKLITISPERWEWSWLCCRKTSFIFHFWALKQQPVTHRGRETVENPFFKTGNDFADLFFGSNLGLFIYIEWNLEMISIFDTLLLQFKGRHRVHELLWDWNTPVNWRVKADRIIRRLETFLRAHFY